MLKTDIGHPCAAHSEVLEASVHFEPATRCLYAWSRGRDGVWHRARQAARSFGAALRFRLPYNAGFGCDDRTADHLSDAQTHVLPAGRGGRRPQVDGTWSSAAMHVGRWPVAVRAATVAPLAAVPPAIGVELNRLSIGWCRRRWT